MKLTKSAGLRGELSIPGDKSISHRAVMFGSLAKGTTHISNFLSGADCLSTIDCFRKMGVLIEQDGTNVTVHGNGLHGLKAPSETLDVGNSGTTTRLISGILAGQDFETVLSGDASLNKRPMGRIIKPLEQMGAKITSVNGNGCAPLKIEGTKLNATSKILCVISRIICRWQDKRDRTSIIKKSYRINASFFWSESRIT